jgi:hypothetical protein
MPKTRPFSRIAITLPQKDLAAADRLAAAQDRSRSWVIAEALRRYVASVEAPSAQDAIAVETSASPRPVGLGASRLAQLKADLSLTPEARVRAAEETLRLTGKLAKPRAQQLVAFDRYEDFLDWKATRDLTG